MGHKTSLSLVGLEPAEAGVGFEAEAVVAVLIVLHDAAVVVWGGHDAEGIGVVAFEDLDVAVDMALAVSDADDVEDDTLKAVAVAVVDNVDDASVTGDGVLVSVEV